jgi:hypothetical protein
MSDTFMLKMSGLFVSMADINFRVDSKAVPVGMYINFADTLGGESETISFRLDSKLRLNRSHAISAAYYKIAFNGSKKIDRDITINGNTFNANAQLDTTISMDIYKLIYQFSLLNTNQAEIAVQAGLHIAGLGIEVNRSAVNQREKIGITAPLPVFGFYVDYKFSPELMAYVNSQLFMINFDNKFRGGLQDFTLGAEYRIIPNLALGGAFNSFQMQMKLENDSAKLTMGNTYVGMMVNLSLYL